MSPWMRDDSRRPFLSTGLVAAARLSMAVAVVKVGVVRMLVPKRFMPVPMRMRLGRHPLVGVLMMFVVDVTMFVLERFVRMFDGCAAR